LDETPVILEEFAQKVNAFFLQGRPRQRKGSPIPHFF
jgi:hypothetical protein